MENREIINMLVDKLNRCSKDSSREILIYTLTDVDNTRYTLADGAMSAVWEALREFSRPCEFNLVHDVAFDSIDINGEQYSYRYIQFKADFFRTEV